MKTEFLQHDDGTKFLPITHQKAVLDDNGRNVIENIEAAKTEVTALIDAKEGITAGQKAEIAKVKSKANYIDLAEYSGVDIDKKTSFLVMFTHGNTIYFASETRDITTARYDALMDSTGVFVYSILLNNESDSTKYELYGFISTREQKLYDSAFTECSTIGGQDYEYWLTNAVALFSDNDKQDKLISGTSIKTINYQSILGSGNINIGGGGGTGGKYLIVTMSNVTETSATTDKTSTEVASAMKEGTDVYYLDATNDMVIKAISAKSNMVSCTTVGGNVSYAYAHMGNSMIIVSTELALQSDLDNKVDKDGTKVLSTNDYTDADKAEVTKVASKADQSSLSETNEEVSALSLNLQGKMDTPDSKTIAGFGITDAYTKDDVDSAVSAKISEPTTEGTSGQALVTDGKGGRSWQTIEGGGGSSEKNWNYIGSITLDNDTTEYTIDLGDTYENVCIFGTRSYTTSNKGTYDIYMNGVRYAYNIPFTYNRSIAWFERLGSILLAKYIHSNNMMVGGGITGMTVQLSSYVPQSCCVTFSQITIKPYQSFVGDDTKTLTIFAK